MQGVTNPLSSSTGTSTGAASIGGAPHPPPRHHDAPAAGTLVQPSVGSGSSTAPASATTGAGSGHAGKDLGQKASGIFGAIHGAGEALRGTINSTIDGLGDAVAGRHEPAASRSSQGSSEQVAQKGMEEVREGYAKVHTGSGAQTTTATPGAHTTGTTGTI